MALSDEKIAEIGEACGLGCKIADAGYPCDMLWFDSDPTKFARSIEAEIRKQDEAPIRQMLEALSLPCDRWNGTQSRIVREAIDAANAWLEGKP